MINLVNKELKHKMVKTDKYCSLLNCKCKTCGICPEKKEPQNDKICCNKKCICAQGKSLKHNHDNCEHAVIFHVDHFD